VERTESLKKENVIPVCGYGRECERKLAREDSGPTPDVERAVRIVEVMTKRRGEEKESQCPSDG